MWWSTSSGRIELNITKADAASASHSGPCDISVAWLRRNRPELIRQLDKLDPALVAAELREYGAWDDAELADHEANLNRLVWIACNDITEELFTKGR
jgi:hypothetical protein